MKFVAVLLTFFAIIAIAQPTMSNDFTFFGKINGKEEEFHLYYDSTGKRMLQVKEKVTILFACVPGKETTASYTPATKECKVGCVGGKKCDLESCRGCFLPPIWDKLTGATKSTIECENVYGMKGIKWTTASEGNEFCFATDDLTPIYLQSAGNGKLLRYDVKTFKLGRPSEELYKLPEFCKCPKMNPFDLLNRY
jgi:hypothetical protein